MTRAKHTSLGGIGFSGAGETLSRVEVVAKDVSDEFHGLGIHHALVGGLALATYGYARMTADVDILVLEADRVHGSPLGIPGVTFKRDKVSVDVLFIVRGEDFLRREILTAPKTPEGVPVLNLPALIYLKLKSSRAKDFADIVELLKVDLNRIATVRRWLYQHAPRLVERFENAAHAARSESR